jgi:hypothetical protein
MTLPFFVKKCAVTRQHLAHTVPGNKSLIDIKNIWKARIWRELDAPK